jgi:hypothetical protein
VAYLKIVECMICLNYSTYKIVTTVSKAVLLSPERSEHFYILGLYFIDICNYDMAYYCFYKIKNNQLGEILNKFESNIMINAYGNNINYLLAVSSMNTNRNEEATCIFKELLIDETISSLLKLKINDQLKLLL